MPVPPEGTKCIIGVVVKCLVPCVSRLGIPATSGEKGPEAFATLPSRESAGEGADRKPGWLDRSSAMAARGTRQALEGDGVQQLRIAGADNGPGLFLGCRPG